MPSPMLERRVEQALSDAVRRLGGLAYKFTSPGTTGVPDRFVALPCGCARLVELKRPKGGTLSARQRIVHKDLARVGHYVAVVWTLEEVAAWEENTQGHVLTCTAARPRR